MHEELRAALGTSPYERSEVLLWRGFSDQAHFTRVFKAAFGLTPGRYRALRVAPADLTGRRPVQ